MRGHNPINRVDPFGLTKQEAVLLACTMCDGVLNGVKSWWNTSVAAAQSERLTDGVIKLPQGLNPEVGVGVTAGIEAIKGIVGVESAAAKEVTLSRALHGETAAHAADAIKAGKPSVLTIDRADAAANRQASTGALDKVAGKHLDEYEYPPAMFREGGTVRVFARSIRATTCRQVLVSAMPVVGCRTERASRSRSGIDDGVHDRS